MNIFTDGACINNGKPNAIAGIGVFLADNDPRNVSRRVEGKQTNNVAELSAILEVFTILEEEIKRGDIINIYSDSTYSIVSGNSEPAQIVEPHLADIVKKTRTKVFFSTFSSSIGRIKQALKVAKDHGRQAAILGDSMSKKINIARKLGYLSGFENTVISVDKLKSLPSHKSMLIVTGSQGEKNSVLMIW